MGLPFEDNLQFYSNNKASQFNQTIATRAKISIKLKMSKRFLSVIAFKRVATYFCNKFHVSNNSKSEHRNLLQELSVGNS